MPNPPGSKEYSGLVEKAPQHLQTGNEPRFVFSGSDKSGQRVYFAFSIIELPSKITAAQFLADLQALPGNVASGQMTLYPPSFRFGLFTYLRPDGSEGGADAQNVRQLTREQMMQPPGHTKPPAPQATPAREIPPPAPEYKRQAELPPPPQTPPRSRGMGRSF